MKFRHKSPALDFGGGYCTLQNIVEESYLLSGGQAKFDNPTDVELVVPRKFPVLAYTSIGQEKLYLLEWIKHKMLPQYLDQPVFDCGMESNEKNPTMEDYQQITFSAESLKRLIPIITLVVMILTKMP